MPVVPPPTSTTAPSEIPSTEEAAVGSSTMLVRRKPAASTTFPMAFTLPSRMPGGMAQAPASSMTPRRSSNCPFRCVTARTAPM